MSSTYTFFCAADQEKTFIQTIGAPDNHYELQRRYSINALRVFVQGLKRHFKRTAEYPLPFSRQSL